MRSLKQKTLSDFHELIHWYYPSAASPIEIPYTAQMNGEKLVAESATRIGNYRHTQKPGTIIYIEAVNNFMGYMHMIQSGMQGSLFNNQNPNPFRTPQRAKLNALSIEGDTEKRSPLRLYYNLYGLIQLTFRQVYSTKTFVIPVVLFSVTYNIPKFFELTTENVIIRNER